MSLEEIAFSAFAPVLCHIRDGRIPGASIGLVDRAGVRAVRFAGLAQSVPQPQPIGWQTAFDLASLTKVIFTTTAILRMVDAGRLTLETPLAAVIPDLRQYDPAAPERTLTIGQCLSHQTFLPAVEPLYTYGQDPATLRAFVLQRDWRRGPPVYSDINFILLGIVLERLTGLPLDKVPTPPGTTFRPDPAACAATEACPWRGRVLRGEVHDENAFALGGAAGHAGLFGSMDAVLEFARGILTGTGLSPAGLAAIRRTVAGHRSMGWQIAHAGWSGGDACTPGSIGHTGFTGTGLWIDFDRGIAWSLLTNRVHPSRHADSGIMPLRAEVGTLICTELDRMKGRA